PPTFPRLPYTTPFRSGDHGLRGEAELGGHLGDGVGLVTVPPQSLRGLDAQPAGRGVGVEGDPGILEIRARGGGELAHLRFGQLGGVVARVPLGGQPLALDRIGEDDARPGVVDGLERREELAEGMAAEGAAPRGPAASVSDRPASRRSWPSLGWARSSRWYSGLGIFTSRSFSACPPGAAKTPSSRRPQGQVRTCQPAASNMPWRRLICTSGMTRS